MVADLRTQSLERARCHPPLSWRSIMVTSEVHAARVLHTTESRRTRTLQAGRLARGGAMECGASARSTTYPAWTGVAEREVVAEEVQKTS